MLAANAAGAQTQRQVAPAVLSQIVLPDYAGRPSRVKRDFRVLFLHSHSPHDAYTHRQTEGWIKGLTSRIDGSVIVTHPTIR